MRMDKLTHQLQTALADAQSIAIGRDHTSVEPAHMLLGLLNQSSGSVRPILNRAGFDIEGLKAEIERLLDEQAKTKLKLTTRD